MFIWIAVSAVMLSGIVGVREFDMSDWDEVPEPNYFALCVRVDGLNPRPVLESLNTQMMASVPKPTIVSERRKQFCGLLGGHQRVERHSSRGIDLAALVNDCQSRADSVMKQKGWTSKITLCVIDSRGNRFVATDQDDPTHAVDH